MVCVTNATKKKTVKVAPADSKTMQEQSFVLHRIKHHASNLIKKPTDEAIRYAYSFLASEKYIVNMDGNGNLIARRGEGIGCLNAHSDIVGEENIEKLKTLGVDDRVGMAICLAISEIYTGPLTILFTYGEEVGSTGAVGLDPSVLKGIEYILTADRRNGKDLVTRIYGERICSIEFEREAIKTIGQLGYVPIEGIFADPVEFRRRNLVPNCVNMSCGYYEPHTENDFWKPEESLNCANAMIKLLNELPKGIPAGPPVKGFDLSAISWKDDDYWNTYDDENDTIIDTPTCSICGNKCLGKFSFEAKGMGDGDRLLSTITFDETKAVCKDCNELLTK